MFGVPPLLGWRGMKRVEGIEAELGTCSDAIDRAIETDRLFELEAINPLYAERALEHRAALVLAVHDGLRGCRHERPINLTGGQCAAAPIGIPRQLQDRGLSFLRDRLPAVMGSQLASGPRARLRSDIEAMHVELGFSRELVELSKHLPPGGEVDDRVAAYLQLGDPLGARAVLGEPGAETNELNDALENKHVLACLAGDYAMVPDLAEWAKSRDFDEDALEEWAECALRAGDLGRLSAGLDAAETVYGRWLPPTERSGDTGRDRDERLKEIVVRAHIDTAKRYYGARLKAAEGDLEAVLTALEAPEPLDDMREAVVAIWAAAKLGRFQQVLEVMSARTVADALDQISHHPETPIYTGIYPGQVVDEGLLAEAIAVLSASSKPPLKVAAGKLKLLQIAHQAYRGDLGAKHGLDAAVSLLGAEGDRAKPLRRFFDAFDGDWKTPAELDVRVTHAIGPGSSPQFGDHRRRLEDLFCMDGEDPRDVIASLRAQGRRFLDRGLGERALLRLQVIVSIGRRLGVDVSADVAQLDRLRAMVERPGNAFVLTATDRQHEPEDWY
ncbi:MAG: hypothetical protein AB7R00_17640 [Kofleriaceae bacterium]